MSPHPILLNGGGNLAKAEEAAAVLENAEGVALDLADDDLGLGERRSVPSPSFSRTRGSPGSVSRIPAAAASRCRPKS